MMIPSYLIHSKVTFMRKQRAMNALKKYTSDIIIIDCFDAQDLQTSLIHSDNSSDIDHWDDQIDIIKPILVDNFHAIRATKSISNSSSYISLIKNKKNQLNLPRFEWLKFRALTPGEKSVNMKHHFAISSIAMGESSTAL